MSDILLSVIVPIYNAELYLERCIDSILNQTYPLIEIVLIDDGSEDLSGEICDRYAEEYHNIRVIHQENKGLVYSRKIGVDSAKGSAIAFVDADDWIESDMYEAMMQKFSEYNADIVTAGLIFEYTEKIEYLFDFFQEGEYTRKSIKKDILPHMMCYELEGVQGITASLCNKVFRHDLLREELQLVDKRLTYGEDGAVVFPLIARCECIYILHKKWYHYIQYDNSMIHSFSIKSCEKVHCLIDYMKNRFLQLGLLEMMEEQIAQYTKPFLKMAIESVYGVSIYEAFYLFPYEEIPKGSKIIIYGAGVVGKSYYKSLYRNSYVKVVGWIDKKEKQIFSIKTENVNILSEREFDYIVIAIENEGVAMMIQDMLLDIGIRRDKIFWKKPHRVQ